MKVNDKQIKTGDVQGELQKFTFPHYPQPIVVEANSREEAEKKFNAIINRNNQIKVK